jgi:hypothetical protein
MPSGESGGFDDDERLFPVKQPGQKNHGEPSGVVGSMRPFLTLLIESELLSEKQILGSKRRARTEEIPAEGEGVEQ